MFCGCGLYLFFFFKQKTAYEMRISDWSSDVCSSDLARPSPAARRRSPAPRQSAARSLRATREQDPCPDHLNLGPVPVLVLVLAPDQIGRASCRERVCQYV